MKYIFLYTMTAGLGDVVVMSSLANAVEAVVPDASVLFMHRGNPHIYAWDSHKAKERYYNIYSFKEVIRLANRIRSYKKYGCTIFGLQMAPGSVQGFALLSVLKQLKLVDLIVDFNLVNADIITPPAGDYILELHLNQIACLTKNAVPVKMFKPVLPQFFLPRHERPNKRKYCIGIHPWSRRGYHSSFVWQQEKWLELIKSIFEFNAVSDVVLFGKNDKFNEFADYLRAGLGPHADRLIYKPSEDIESLVNTITSIDMLVSVNTSVVHIGYALNVPMVVLCGPTLDIWIPKAGNIISVRDDSSMFQASDRETDDSRFGTIQRILTNTVFDACKQLMGQTF